MQVTHLKLARRQITDLKGSSPARLRYAPQTFGLRRPLGTFFLTDCLRKVFTAWLTMSHGRFRQHHLHNQPMGTSGHKICPPLIVYVPQKILGAAGSGRLGWSRVLAREKPAMALETGGPAALASDCHFCENNRTERSVQN